MSDNPASRAVNPGSLAASRIREIEREARPLTGDPESDMHRMCDADIVRLGTDNDALRKTLQSNIVREAMLSYRRQWEVWFELIHTTDAERELARVKIELIDTVLDAARR